MLRWNKPAWVHFALPTLLLLVLGASMGACSAGTENWKEEVQLSNGQIIVVEREIILGHGGDEWASNRSGTKPNEYRIRFEYLDGKGKLIQWRSTKISPQTWPEIPLILDIESGQLAVFSLVAISNGCEVYSKYLYQNGIWIEEQLPEQFEPLKSNLFLKLGVDMPKSVSLEKKQLIYADSRYQHALKHVGPNRKVCGD